MKRKNNENVLTISADIGAARGAPRPRFLASGTASGTLATPVALYLRPIEDVVEFAVHALGHVFERAEQFVVAQVGGDVLLLEGGLRRLGGRTGGKD